jgi:hypothetical protein
VVIGVVFRWLWKSSLNERASVEAGRTVFPPTRAVRSLAVLFGVAFTSLFLWSWLAVRKPMSGGCHFCFLVLSRSVYAFTRRSYPSRWTALDRILGWDVKKKIRWEDVTSLRYNSGSKQFTVCANDGRKITHAGFNAEPGLFQNEIQKRTRLPMKLTRPGTWKAETIEVPYDSDFCFPFRCCATNLIIKDKVLCGCSLPGPRMARDRHTSLRWCAFSERSQWEEPGETISTWGNMIWHHAVVTFKRSAYFSNFLNASD